MGLLSVETSLFLNVETKPRMKWCGDGETKPTENLHLGKQNIGISHYEKIKKWPPFGKYALYGKISNY